MVYFFAAEFSRYFELMDKGEEEEAQKTFNELVKTMRDLFAPQDKNKEVEAS